jgi:ABC-type dipeptide/oligopeptide/nickel transport system ATPase subunit
MMAESLAVYLVYQKDVTTVEWMGDRLAVMKDNSKVDLKADWKATQLEKESTVSATYYPPTHTGQ